MVNAVAKWVMLVTNVTLVTADISSYQTEFVKVCKIQNLHFKPFDICLIECNCSPSGSKNNTCNAKGECFCNSRLITGAKCGNCTSGFFNFPNCQCKSLFFKYKTGVIHFYC